MHARLALLALVGTLAVATGCPAKPTPSHPAPLPSPTAPQPAPPPPMVRPEPPGLVAGSVEIPAAPKGKGAWVLDAAQTQLSFIIASNAAGGITGRFPGGASGALDGKAKKGVFFVDLATLVTVNPKQEKEPARDTNVVEAFFGARAFAAEAKRAAVDQAWQTLEGKLKRGVPRATLVIDTIEGPAADPPDGAPGEMVKGAVHGTLILWESVTIPVAIGVAARRHQGTIEVISAQPITFNLEKLLGTSLRNALFGTLVAAGCAHEAGIQSDVGIVLEKIVLKVQAK